MKKIIVYIIIMNLSHAFSQNQAGSDIVTPQQEPFTAGQDIEGFVQNSVNETTGKVNFTIPITNIASRGVSYDITLNYNGDRAEKAATYHNRYVGSGPYGVGFNMSVPKIVADYKSTATREDDTYYLVDETSTKLVCTGRVKLASTETGTVTWSFKTKQFSNTTITYYEYLKRDLNGPGSRIPLDYWVIKDSNGQKFYYGSTLNARENLVAWGNWIGDSKQPGGKRHTIAWNLSKIEDQWSNNLQFEYFLQENTVGGVSQTEASYLKKISSSTGEKIELDYIDLRHSTFYEPHREQQEPDAYQERYYQYFLKNIISYNANGAIQYSHDLRYTRKNNTDIYDQKNYLSSIVQENANGNYLPSQEFQYYETNDYKKGLLQKITYPHGGSITYTYENDYIFNNGADKFTGNLPDLSNYYYYAVATKSNYVIEAFKSKQEINGKRTFLFVRYFWNGKGWDIDSFQTPYRIRDTYPDGSEWLVNFKVVFGDDFYGFLYREGEWADIDLFHLENNERTWNHYSTSKRVGGNDPVFLSGNNFVAVGTHRLGYLYTFTWEKNPWNRNNWSSSTINQGAGQYYYNATNNFILSLDEDGGNDMITGSNHEDNYYIHYLDIENDWQTKSWSAKADPYFAGIEEASYFYPNNAMAGFVADDNREYFLRWDVNYNLQAPDDVIGGYNDRTPLIPTYTGMFCLQQHWYQYPLKLFRFNGAGWDIGSVTNSGDYAKPTYGEDMMTYQNQNGNRIGISKYNPNTGSWNSYSITSQYPWYQSNNKLTTLTRDFRILGSNIYTTSNTGESLGLELPYETGFCHSDGLGHGYVKLVSHEETSGAASEIFEKGSFIYRNKKTNEITSIDLGKLLPMTGPYKFAGRTPIISPNALFVKSEGSSFRDYLYRIINDQVKQSIYETVVQQIEVDNDNGEKRYISYTYNDPQPTPGNEATYYENVIVENKGFGNNSNGTIHKKFDTGAEDLRRAGLLLEERVKNTGNGNISFSQTTWNVSYKDASYCVKPSETINTSYYGGSPMSTTTEYFYNTEHQLPYLVKKTNSKNQIEEVRTTFAYEQYNFMADNNFITQPYELVSSIDGETVSVERTNWVNTNGKIYAKEVFSGTTESTLRKTNEVTRMNTNGQIEESSNGKNQYNAILYGYNYKHPVATISNATYAQVTGALDVSVSSLQTLSNASLRAELLKLYDNLPNAMVTINLYDDQGRIVETLNERKYPSKVNYDEFGRMDYTVDHNDKVLSKNVYHLKTEGE